MDIKTNWLRDDYLNIEDYIRIHNNFLELYRIVLRKEYDGEKIPVPFVGDYGNKVYINFFILISLELEKMLATIEDKNKVYVNLLTEYEDWINQNVLDYNVMNDIERAMQVIYNIYTNPNSNVIYDYCYEQTDYNTTEQIELTEQLEV